MKTCASVLIRNYNSSRFIEEAVLSVLTQSYPNFELLIRDDGSSDQSPEILSRLAKQDSRIKVFLETNKGRAEGLNILFKKSKGDLLCFLDADDVWKPDKLEKVVFYFKENKNAGLIIHSLDFINKDSKRIKDPWRYKHNRHNYSTGHLLNLMLSGNEIILPPTSALSLRKELGDIIFPIPPFLNGNEDTFIREKAGLLSEIFLIKEALGYMRLHDSNFSMTRSKNMSEKDFVLKICNEYRMRWKMRSLLLRDLHGIDVDSSLWFREIASVLLSEQIALYRRDLVPTLLPMISSKRKRVFFKIMFLFPKGLTFFLRFHFLIHVRRMFFEKR